MPAILREARPEDAVTLVEFIQHLADYEREPDAVRNTPERVVEHLFGERPAVFAHVVEDVLPGRDEPQIVGIAIWFLTYSTWEGVHGIHLEDLFVLPEARGRGHGKALLQHLARLCAERGYARLEWMVLDWNEPAIGFYDALEAGSLDGWTMRRLDGDALLRAGAAAPAETVTGVAGNSPGAGNPSS